MTVLLQVRTRRLARFGGSVCVATDLDFRWAHASALPPPPTPPHDENRPEWGQAKQVGGGSIARAYEIFHAGGHRVLEKPGDWPRKRSQVVDSLRKTPPRVSAKFPRNGVILPRFDGFLPRAVFLISCAIYLSLSLFFIGERERKRRKNERKRDPRVFDVLRRNNPGIFALKIETRGLRKTKNTYESMAYLKVASFPRSTGRNAYTPLEKVRNER